MRTMKIVAVTGLILAGLGFSATVVQNYYSPRQYYGNWVKHPSHSYYYRNYYYKPTPTYTGYKHHYVIHYPSRPKHYYYYNHYKKQYWGRCDSQCNGEPHYSMLAPEDRKATLAEIPETAFPAPTATPPIPEATDNVSLDLPPDDAPPANAQAIALPVDEKG